MINRRDLLKTFGTALAGVVLPGNLQASPDDIKEPIRLQGWTTRTARYRKYEEMFVTDISKPYVSQIKSIANDLYRIYHFDRSNFTKMTFKEARLYILVFSAAVYGDAFVEVVKAPDYPNPVNWQFLPAQSMFRIETIKGKLLEFQQSMEGPDYAAMMRFPIDDPRAHTDPKATAIRFHPDQIVHIRPNLGKFYPYGTSALHEGGDIDLRFREDAMKGVHELVEKFKL